jgi:uncharacterized protein (DUF924 family)
MTLIPRAAAAAILSVAEFAVRPAIQRALASPRTPESVLTFFFGVDYNDKKSSGIYMRQGYCFSNGMEQLWYQGGAEYDALCQHFTEAVRAAGRNEFVPTRQQQEILFVDDVMAQLVLCDQLARNIFRGMSEAFQYEEPALTACRALAAVLLPGQMDVGTPSPSVSGEIYPPYMSFMVTALMHSESREDHELAQELLAYAKNSCTAVATDIWDQQAQFAADHKSVIDRFGRYPHRNKVKGRTCTADEEAWLADTDQLPGWAKSQTSK